MSGPRRKVLLVANTAWYLYNFRRGLIRALVAEGNQVTVVSPPDRYTEALTALGVRWRAWPLSRGGMRPLEDWRSLRWLQRLYRQEAPDVVHHFTIKAILYGTVVARRTGVPAIVNSVTGLGHMFLSDRPFARVLRPLIRRWYAWALTTKGVRAIFQNQDDLTELARSSPELLQQALLTHGSGVNLERFVPASGSTTPVNGRKCVLFAGRLIREKGIREFVEAGRLCRQHGNDFRFVACGNPDAGNPSSVEGALLREWEQEGVVQFLGHVDHIEEQLREADVAVLPSYREGTPRFLLEASAMGKPIIATDVPGCREVVVDGQTGLLVPPRDPAALAAAIERLMTRDQMRSRMGAAARRHVVEQFDEKRVVSQTIGVYDELLRPSRATAKPPAVSPLPRGVFVISLDFELAWGTRGRPAARRVGPFLDGTRNAIRGLLDLFEKHEIAATWAVVGGLLMAGRGTQDRHPWLTDGAFADVPAGDAGSQPHWYAEDVLEWLRTHPVPQELACHTLTHRFVDSTPAGRETFREDLRRFRRLFEDCYLDQPRSFIFPKARMAHFDVLAEEGFRCVRGPESGWFERLPGEILPAGFRLLDATLACRPKVGLPERLPEGVWVLPSSQFYSPFLSVGKHIPVDARVRKAIKGLRLAAEHKRIYHLWTHPFNLGVRTDELLAGLDQILGEARRLSHAGHLEVLTMGALAQRLDQEAERSPVDLTTKSLPQERPA